MKNLSFFSLCLCVSFGMQASELETLERSEEQVAYDLALEYAVCSGDIEAAQRVLQAGANVNAVPLAIPVLQKNHGMVRFLIDQGIDVNGQDREGRTGLYAACAAGLNDMAELLLEKNADPFIVVTALGSPIHRAGDTALHAACRNPKCSPATIERILREADRRRRGRQFVNTTNADGESCLHPLLSRGDFDDETFKILNEILRRGANPNLQERRMMATPLHKASEPKGNPQHQMTALTILLNAGGNPEIADRCGTKVEEQVLRRRIVWDVRNKKAISFDHPEATAILIARQEAKKLEPAPVPVCCDTDCAICLAPITCGAERTLPCNHTFHSSSCLDRWFKEQRDKHLALSCPMCRNSNVEQ